MSDIGNHSSSKDVELTLLDGQAQELDTVLSMTNSMVGTLLITFSVLPIMGFAAFLFGVDTQGNPACKSAIDCCMKFSRVKDTADCINIYPAAGGFVVQNKTGYDLVFIMSWRGSR